MNLIGLFNQRVVQPIRRAQGSPESIARGGAMGVWVALTPTVGVQMPLVLLLSVPLKANMAIAVAMCWITNPLTLIPFYFAFYWMGALVLGRHAQGFTEVGERLSHAIGGIPDDHSLVEGLRILGNDLLWPMLVGSTVIATISAVPTYFLILGYYRRKARDGAGAAAVQGPDHD